MKTLLLLVFLFCVTGVSAKAQSDTPRVEIFGGYSYFNGDPIHGDNSKQRRSANGVGVGVAGNLNSSFGVAADFSGHHGSIDIFGVKRDWTAYTFLFGPRFSARGQKVTGFAHFLIGGVTLNVEQFRKETQFAMAIGGGLDANLSRRFAVRLVQLDYLPVRDDTRRAWSHKFRAQTGVVFRW